MKSCGRNDLKGYQSSKTFKRQKDFANHVVHLPYFTCEKTKTQKY